MLKNSKLLAGAVAAGAVIFSTGAVAGDGKGAVYGDIRWSLNAAEGPSATTPGAPNYSATNNNSYYGIKGSIAGSGLTAFGAYERTLDNDGAFLDFTRQGYVGLKSDFGAVKYGQFGTAYFESGRKVDPFANTAVAGVAAAPGATNSHGLSATLTAETFGAGFIANQVAYTSPSFGGLTVNAAFFVDETTTLGVQNQDHDYGMGVEYSNAGITVGVQALDINGTGNFAGLAQDEAQRLYGGFNTARFGVNASAEKISFSGAADADLAFVSGWFGVTDATRLALAVSNEHNTTAEGNSVSLGVFHDVMENFTGWVAARRYDGKNLTSGAQNDVITLGASYKFNLGFGS